MENIGDEYKLYWETNMFLQNQELDSWGFDEAISGYDDSSSPDGAASSSTTSKNIVSERNRRKKLNDRLFALRAVVPNISKMDKASIIKDAIEYIKELEEQQRRVKAEISEIEFGKTRKSSSVNDLEQELPSLLRSKKKRTHLLLHNQSFDSACWSTSAPIQDLEVRVSYVGERTVVVTLTCNRRRDTMAKLCEALESLKLNLLACSLTSFSSKLLTTLFIQADEDEKDELKLSIETAIAALNDPQSPMSI